MGCLLCFMALVACGSLEAQTSIKLSATRNAPHTRVCPRDDTAGEMRCQREHFLQRFGWTRPSKAALQRMSADGKSVLTINTKTGDFARSNPSDFNTAPDGTLYAVLSTRHNYLVEFDEHGEMKRQTEISVYERASEIDNFAALSSDRFLIAGRLFEKGQPGQGFTAIIDADGKLVRDVKLQNGIDPTEQNAGDVVLGPAITGDDGNAYVLRTSAEGARVYVISASGEVLRTLVVPTPVPKGIAGQFGVAKGHLAIEFHRDDLPTWFKVVDTQTGDEIASYESDVWGLFVCYSLDGFDFFVNDPTTKKFDLVRAVPR